MIFIFTIYRFTRHLAICSNKTCSTKTSLKNSVLSNTGSSIWTWIYCTGVCSRCCCDHWYRCFTQWSCKSFLNIYIKHYGINDFLDYLEDTHNDLVHLSNSRLLDFDKYFDSGIKRHLGWLLEEQLSQK